MTLRPLIFTLIIFCSQQLWSQESPNPRRGIVKVQKTGLLAFIKFDNVNYRLIAIDRYGNINDTAVVEFTIRCSIRGLAYKETTASGNLSMHLQQLLYRRDGTTTLYFSKIKARDKNGTLLEMPDFKYTFRYNDYEY